MTASADEIRQAAQILESGGLIAFPTETVYGLGADAENPQAVAQIFAVKGRPSNHPLIVHLAPEADINYWADDIPDVAHKLIAAFWPGPLTLIVKRAKHIPDAVTGGQDSIGLRCPSHPVAQALLRAFKAGRGGIAAPSANRFGHVSPTTAQHVRDEFGDEIGSETVSESGGRIGMILDGGQSAVGIESTILDLSRWQTHGAVLLRPGQISVQAIADVIDAMPQAPDAAAPRASGTLEAHYAPRTPVLLLATSELVVLFKKMLASGKRVAVMHHSPMTLTGAVAQQQLPPEAGAYAHDLYATLRSLDLAKADCILIETLPQGAEWQGVNDRLRRAAHDSIGLLS